MADAEIISIFTLSVVIFFGIIAGRIAENFNFPKTIPLIITGMLLAIISNIASTIGLFEAIHIDIEGIREIAVITAELALITVLFKEGMHLKLSSFKKYILIIAIIAFLGTITTTMLVGFTVFITFPVGISLALALLIGAIFTPTDPAATFAVLRGGGTRIHEKYETILGGESALNDVLAIILVVVILIPGVTGDNLVLNLDTIFVALWQFFGGAILGLIVGYFTLILIKSLPTRTEESMITLGTTTFLFAIGFISGTSSAIAALVAGIVLGNPKLFNQSDYIKSEINSFWDNLTFLFEILAFIFIGAIFSLSEINSRIIIFAFMLSIIVIIGRIAGIFLITGFLEITKHQDQLNNKERFFIGFAGMRGLTTAILASLAYISLSTPALAELGQLILYSSILVLIITGIFQGIFLKKVAKRTDVLDISDEVDELFAQKIVVKSSLDFLVDQLNNDAISTDNFQRLSIPLKEELYSIRERLTILKAEKERNKEFLELNLLTLQKAKDRLELAHNNGEISETSFDKALDRIEKEQKDILIHFDKIPEKPGLLISKDLAKADELTAEVNQSLAEAAISVLNDPKVNKFLSNEYSNLKNFLGTIKKKGMKKKGFDEKKET